MKFTKISGGKLVGSRNEVGGGGDFNRKSQPSQKRGIVIYLSVYFGRAGNEGKGWSSPREVDGGDLRSRALRGGGLW